MRKACCVAFALLLWGGAATAPVERRLHLGAVEASSFLWNDWNKFQENYHPLYVADGDPTTAWVEGAKGPGVGEWIRLKVTPLDGATRVRLRIRNGYQKSAHLFEANARVKDLTVKLLPGGKTQKATLQDAQGWQEIVVEQPAGAFAGVELRVESIYAGKKYEDLCISDIELFATATTPDNPAFEKAKLEKVLAWKAERVKAAHELKSFTAKQLPLAAQYKSSEAKDAPTIDLKCKIDDPFCAAREHVAELLQLAPSHKASLEAAAAMLKDRLKGFVPVQAVPLDKRPFPPGDGVCSPRLSGCEASCWQSMEMPTMNMVGTLFADQVGLFDVKESPALEATLAGKTSECRHADSKGRLFHWAKRAKTADGKDQVTALLTVRCGTVETRDGSSVDVVGQLLVYGGDGKLEVITDRMQGTVFDWGKGAAGPLITKGTITNSNTAQVFDEAVAAN
jgi:hypothetical protein